MNDALARTRNHGNGRRARFLAAVCAVVVALTGTSLAGVAHAEADRIVTTNGSGAHNGFFYWFWKDTGDVAMTLGPDGTYSARWSGVNDWIGGKGWRIGGPRVVRYSATFDPGGNSYLALYGQATDPNIEYYVVENWGTYRPGGTFWAGTGTTGTVTSDGGTYDIYRETISSPLIQASWLRYRYWSVRRERRTSGTITVGNHFDAWARAGMNLGTHGFMIMATEGYQSRGSSSVTVSEVPGGDDTATGSVPVASTRPSELPQAVQDAL